MIAQKFVKANFPTLILLTAGCFPATFTTVPEIKGRIVDSSGKPVPGANVQLQNAPGSRGAGHLNDIVTADNQGRIFRKEETRWFLYVVPMDAIRAADYEAYAFDGTRRTESKRFGSRSSKVRFFGLGSPDRADLGDLMLH